MATKSKAPKNRREHTAPKTVLKLPDLDQAKSSVLNSLSSTDAQRGSRHAIDEFVDWYCSEPRLSFNRTVVLRYRMHLESRNLAPGTINLRLGAVRRLAYEAADCGLLSPDLAAGIRRVKGVIAPHDLRRSCARLCHTAGGEVDQIQFLLGHVSIQTTERYLGCKQRIRAAVNDRIGIEPVG